MDQRRHRILDAALQIFLERGFDSATMTAIRERSGASTGSIYHFFSGKADIAAELLKNATSGWSLASGEQINSRDAEQVIQASVRGFLLWGRQNSGLFAFMDDVLARSRFSVEFVPVTEMLAAGRLMAAEAYASWVKSGQVRDITWKVAYSLIMGPAYALLRDSGDGPVSDAEMNHIIRAAWEAVAASPQLATMSRHI